MASGGERYPFTPCVKAGQAIYFRRASWLSYIQYCCAIPKANIVCCSQYGLVQEESFIFEGFQVLYVDHYFERLFFFVFSKYADASGYRIQ